MAYRSAAPFDWFLWLQWIMATAWGWILGRILFPGFYVIPAGAVVAAFQWLVLQHRLDRAWRWLPLSAAGWMAGALLALAVGHSEPGAVSGALLGLGIGTAQWLIVRRELRWPAWWPVLSIVGWSTGLGMALVELLAGVAAGAITGLALVLLNFPADAHRRRKAGEMR